MINKFEIIDFHTHPFSSNDNNICAHKDYCNMSIENTLLDMQKLGISKICGSVINRVKVDNDDNVWEIIRENNNTALKLRDIYKGFYIPGFHVHADFVRESCEEIERMHKINVNLIGELVPYRYNWTDYSCSEFSEILDVAEQYNMIVNFHSAGDDEMDKMVANHPNVTFVAAHPGEYDTFMRHMDRMRKNDNYYLDLSGTGIFRHGLLRRAIDLCGVERFLFGTDFPTCNPAMFIGGVLLDNLITDKEKEFIFSKNAKRLLRL